MDKEMLDRLQSVLGNMDKKELEKKLELALNMLKNEKPEELAKKMASIDKNALLNKLENTHHTQNSSSDINVEQIKQKLNEADMGKMSEYLSKNSDALMEAIKKNLKGGT